MKELCDRYNLATTKPLYDRRNALKMEFVKEGNKSYATEEQVALLDQQHKHIKAGGTLKNFVPTAIAEVTQVTVDNTPAQHTSDNGVSSIVETARHTSELTTQHSIQSETTQVLLGDMAQAVANAIAEKMTPPSPTWYLAELERARASGWELTTSQVKDLIGVKPSCKEGKKTFKRGSFIFVKSGKIGNQTSWKVKKVTSDDSAYKA